MNILIVNDDGIAAPGIVRLAQLAKQLGTVTVVAPDRQCSAMSQKLTIFGTMELHPCPDFPVPGVSAWVLNGTPADCVKLALHFVFKEAPDLVLSGINNGSNTGYDIAYSGTLGACYEAVMNGIPAVAFSTFEKSGYEDADAFFLPIMQRLLDGGIPEGTAVNVNFPGCAPDEVRSIDWNVRTATMQMYLDGYSVSESDGGLLITPHGVIITPEQAEPDTDQWSVLHGRIAVGVLPTLKNRYQPRQLPDF